MQATSSITYRFAGMTLDLARGSLRGANGDIELRPKSLNVLTYLLGNAGRVVSRDELLRAVWPDVTVSEESLTRCISDVRSALGDGDATIIKTVPKRGYRLEAAIEKVPPQQSESVAPITPELPSIAVLPFQNLTGEPGSEYFADGVVEELIVALSRFKSLLVISRNSSFSYKDREIDTRLVGGELGVRYLLQGSVRKAGDRVRITGQLIEAATGAHLWADKFDGSLDELFDLQDQVAERVVGAILPRVMQAEIAIASRKPPSIWNCYDRYLRGNALFFQFSSAALEEAKAEFRRALSLDPDFAPALAALAVCSVAKRLAYGVALDAGERSEALSQSTRAAQLAPDDGFVLSRCALTVAALSDNFEKAMILAERAIGLNPSLALAWTTLGWVQNLLGEPERACDAFERATRLNPLDKVMLVAQILPGTSLAYFLLGRRNDWLTSTNRLLALDPNNLTGLLDALSFARDEGRNDDADKLRRRIEAICPGLTRSQVSALFRVFRKPEHLAIFDAWLSALALPP